MSNTTILLVNTFEIRSLDLHSENGLVYHDLSSRAIYLWALRTHLLS